jgi:Raf kinase inhibitor-like YbhB/YbcL family protein
LSVCDKSMDQNNLPNNNPLTQLEISTPAPNTPLLPEPTLGERLFKQLIVIGAALVLILLGAVFSYVKIQAQKKAAVESIPAIITPLTTTTMIIASEVFKNGEYIPAKYTCDGLDINPPLRFAEIPAGTISLALIVDDPDSPSGDWVHWLVWNIPADTQKIDEGVLPSGAGQGTTDFNAAAYGGPCPHSGTHHYQFKLYALNTTLSLPSSAKKSDLLAVMQGHIIAEAQLTGMYSRSN